MTAAYLSACFTVNKKNSKSHEQTVMKFSGDVDEGPRTDERLLAEALVSTEMLLYSARKSATSEKKKHLFRWCQRIKNENFTRLWC